MRSRRGSPPSAGDAPVHLLAVIDLDGADVATFERYEQTVLPLARDHGAEVGPTVRTLDAGLEVHLLRFPSRVALAAFREAAPRVSAQDMLIGSGARVEVHEVREVPYSMPSERRASAPLHRFALWLRAKARRGTR